MTFTDAKRNGALYRAAMKARVAVLGLVCGAVLLGCGATPSPPTVPVATPVVAIPSGLQTRMTATEVADLVLEWIHKSEVVVGHALKPARIVSISASGGPVAGVVWVVKAEGTFVTNRTGPGGPPMMTGTSGYYRISDSDASILEDGFE